MGHPGDVWIQMEHGDTKTPTCFVNKMASTSKGHLENHKAARAKNFLGEMASEALVLGPLGFSQLLKCHSASTNITRLPAPLLVSFLWKSSHGKAYSLIQLYMWAHVFRSMALLKLSLELVYCDSHPELLTGVAGGWGVGLPHGKHSWQWWAYQVVLVLWADSSICPSASLEFFSVPFVSAKGSLPRCLWPCFLPTPSL